MPARRESLELGGLYQESSIALADSTALLTERLFRSLDPNDLQGSFETIIPTIATLILGGQAQTTGLAIGYYQQLGSIELGKTILGVDPLEENVGFTADGRSIEEVLTASRGRMLAALAEGQDYNQAVRKAFFGFRRAARHEVLDAGARELLHQVAESSVTNGWRSRSIGTCSSCLAVDDGSVIRTSPVGGPTPPYHPGCSCVPDPAFDVEESVRRPTGQERFEALPLNEKKEAVGEVRALLLTKNLIDWDDVAMVQTFPEWTPVLTDNSVEKLLAIAGMTADEVLGLDKQAA